jgi:acetylornithine/succinyldiaminopimelate/putrescine aminotransferase
MQQMKAAAGVKSVSGQGLLIGIEPEHKTAKEIAAYCLEHGVLVLTAGHNRVRLLPALNIPESLLDQALQVLKDAFASGKE